MKAVIIAAAVLGLCLSSGSSSTAATKTFMVVKEVASSRSTASADRKSRRGVRSSSSSSRYVNDVDYDLSASSEDQLLPLQLRTPPAAPAAAAAATAVTAVERFLSTNSPLEGETICTDEEECKTKSIELGYLFYTDPPVDLSSTSTKGCFMKNNNVFYIPGTDEEMSVTTLPGIQERVYCSTNDNDDSDVTAPTPVPTITTDDEGEEGEEEDGGDIPTYSPTSTSSSSGGDDDSTTMSLSMSLSMPSSLSPTSTTSAMNSMEGTYSSTSSSTSSSSTMSTAVTSTMSTTATTTTIPDPFDDGSLEITPIISEVEMESTTTTAGGGEEEEDLSLNDIDDLSSLGALIGATGLLDELGKIGPFTLFAPNDAAISEFLSNGDGTDGDGIQDIVLYHVVSGKYSSSSLSSGELVTMNGNSISVQVSDDTGGVTLNDVATVIKADIDLGEGTVHVIDKVLTPPAAAAPVPAVATTSIPTKEVTTMTPTTMKPITTEQDTPEFINPNLKPGEPVPGGSSTVVVEDSTTGFVPSCNSQEECSATTRSQKPAGSSEGVDMCECYATSSTVPFDECEGAQSCATAKCDGNACEGYEAYCEEKIGVCQLRPMETSTTDPPVSLIAQDQPTMEPTTVKEDDTSNMFDNDASVTLGDLTFSITEFVQNGVDLKVLETLIEQTGLLDDLGDVGPLTIFAPNDDAIAEYLKTFPGGYLNTTKKNLQDLLLYHVVAGSYNSSTLETGGIETMNGKSLSVDVSDAGIMINDANVITSDIELFDGTIHIIDKVLVPPGDDNEQEEYDDDEKIDLVLNTTGYPNPNNKPGDPVPNTPQDATTLFPNPNTVEGVTTTTTPDGQLIDVYVDADFITETQPSSTSESSSGTSLPPSTFSSFPTPVGEVPDDGDDIEASGSSNGEYTGSEVPTYAPTLKYIYNEMPTTPKPSFIINANFDSAGSAIAFNTLIVGMLGVVVTLVVSFIM